MKKTAYILSLIIAVTLSGCGNTNASNTIDTQAGLAETADAAAADDQALLDGNSESEGESSESEDKNSKSEGENSERKSVSSKGENSGSEDKAASTTSNTKTPDAANEADTASKATGNAKAREAANNKETSLPEYTVTSFDESKIMYATGSVNIRKGPSTDFERVGGLRHGQEVTVTGQADTSWYEIQYADDKAFVSNKYLQDEKPIDEPAAAPDADANADAQQTPEAQTPSPETEAPQPVTEVKNVAGVILVGDSRFVQMQNSVGENSCTWIAESGKGYNWFNEKAIARIDNCVGNGSKILINLGVNDTGNLQKYISLVNAKADEWAGKGAAVYYASVNPVWENPYVNEEQVEYFNSQMQSSLNGNVHWIDSHSYLNSIGYRLVDGLHYSTETYQNLYAYYMSCM